MAIFNSKTITLKINSLSESWVESDENHRYKYSERKTKLRADALESILLSPNPISKEYHFSDNDFKKIAEARDKVLSIVNEVEELLQSKKQ